LNIWERAIGVGALSGRGEVRRGVYTKGEVNKLIDSCLHPLAKQDGKIFILDSD